MVTLPLEEREKVGRLTRLLLPAYGHCQRCLIPWPLTHEHCTSFDPDGRGTGMFALCESCWAEVPAPERLPYYRLVYEFWLNFGTEVSWRSIEDAVLAGR